jgi:hypothetical protein
MNTYRSKIYETCPVLFNAPEFGNHPKAWNSKADPSAG